MVVVAGRELVAELGTELGLEVKTTMVAFSL